MCRLTILIPWWNEHPAFEDTLISVLENRPDNCEVLVVHSHRYDDPYRLRGEVGFVQCAADGELDLVNTGFWRAQTDIVHLLRCGVRVTDEHWVEAALQHFQDEQVACVAPCLVSATPPHAILSRGRSYGRGGISSQWSKRHAAGRSAAIVAPALEAGFYRRSSVLALDGFDVECDTFCADLELGLALQSLGYRCVAEESSRLRWTVEQPALTERNSAELAERLFWHHTDHSWPSRLAHFAVVTRDLFDGKPAARLAGRLAGYRTADPASHRERLERARTKNESPSDPRTRRHAA